jgi:hypothetical protein
MNLKCDLFSEYKRSFVSVYGVGIMCEERDYSVGIVSEERDYSVGIMSEERDAEAVVKSFRVFGA